MKTTRSGRLRLPKTLPSTIRLISSVHVHHVCCDIEVNFLILLSVLCLCVIFWFCCFKTERFFFVDFIIQWIFEVSRMEFQRCYCWFESPLVISSKKFKTGYKICQLQIVLKVFNFGEVLSLILNVLCIEMQLYHYLIFYLITFSLCSPILKSRIIQYEI